MPQDGQILTKIHLLKTDPNFFDDIKRGKKRFGLRKNDRNFEVGDVLILHKYASGYAEKEGGDNWAAIMTFKDGIIIARITYIVFYSALHMKEIGGLEKDYCIMQIEVRKEERHED